MGSNMAEAHPVGFQWVMEAKARGAKVIHIDPRFTRTSALADRYVPLRAGSDIAFLGGVINYILTNELDFREYVSAYTNASFLVDESYRDTEDLDGLFSGYDAETGDLRPVDLAVRRVDRARPDAGARRHRSAAAPRSARRPAAPPLEGAAGDIPADPTLQHPRCVYQILKRHFARYTPEMVEEVCGAPAEQFLAVAQGVDGATPAGSAPTALVYSVGWTQHSVGAQYIRAGGDHPAAAGQHRPPGRRDPGAARARQHPGLHRHPDAVQPAARLPADADGGRTPTWRATSTRIRARKQKGFWHNADAYMVSLLKEYWGDARHRRRTTSASTTCRGSTATTAPTARSWTWSTGKVFGYFLLGQNPAVGSAHGRLQRLGMANLDWLVVRDLAMIESATFWKDAPEIETGEIVAGDVPHRGVLLPGRLARGEGGHVHPDPADAAVAGEGGRADRRPALRAVVLLPPGPHAAGAAGRLHRRAGPAAAGPVLGLRDDDGDEPSAEDVLRRINGYDLTTGRAGRRLPRPQGRRLDVVRLLDLQRRVRRRGQPGRPAQAARRAGPDRPEWGWAWPTNRRVLYNRASADPQGRPWSERKKLVWWDAGARASGPATTSPTSRRTSRRTTCRPTGAVGVAALRGDDPFVMQADGKGWLFAPERRCSTGRCRRTTSRTSRRCATRCTASRATRRARSTGGTDNPSNPSPPEAHARGVPVRAHRVPAHRAPHRGRDEPARCRTWPSCSRSCSSRCRRSWPRERGLTHLGWATWSPAATAVEARVVVTDRMAPLRVAGPGRAPGLDALPLGQQSGWSTGDVRERPVRGGRSTRTCSSRRARSPPATSSRAAGRAGPAAAGLRRGLPGRGPASRSRRAPHLRHDRRRPREHDGGDTDEAANSLYGPLDDVAGDAGLRRPSAAGRVLHRHLGLHRLQGLRGGVQGVERRPRRRVRPARHVVRQHRRARRELVAARGVHRAAGRAGTGSRTGRSGHAGVRAARATRRGAETRTDFRWLMSSDVCKHCTHAGCLDVCPTGALFRTEFGTVVVQQDICNGCGYCVSGCPYGVIERRDGRRPGVEVHAVLRPAARRAGAGLRQGLPDRLDPVRRARRAARAGGAARRGSCTSAA